MAANPQSQSPRAGICFVISSPTKVTPEAWNKWYDEEHVPDVMNTPSATTAFRYDNITGSTPLASPERKSSQKKEYLALYPVKDIAWWGGDEFATIRTKSAVLGGEGEDVRVCFAVAELEARSYVWIHGFEGEGAKGHPSPGKLILTASMTPPKDQEEEFDRWYKEEQYGMLAKMKGYLRTRRYRIDKTEGTTGREAPKFLAVHEFGVEELDMEALRNSVGTELSKKVMGGLEESQIEVWRMRRSWGDLEVKF